MAEPAQQFNSDQPGNSASDPLGKQHLKALEGGGESSSPDHSWYKGAGSNDNTPTSDNNEDLKALEGGGESSSPDHSWYKKNQGTSSSKKLSKITLPKHWYGRKNLIIGGGLLGLITGAVLFFSTIAGPLQLVHLSNILGKNWDPQAQTSQIRLGRLVRYARTSDPGELRVSRLGSIVANKALGQMSAVGIDVIEKNIKGTPTKIRFDTSKHPDFKDLPVDELKSKMVETYDLKPADIKAACCNGRTFDIAADPSKAGGIKSLQMFKSYKSLSVAENGRIFAWMGSHSLGQYWDVGDLFHPYQRITKSISNKVPQAYTDYLKSQEEARRQKILTRARGEAQPSSEKIKDALGSKPLTAALLASGGLCIVRNVAGDVVKFNHEAIVVPAEIQSVNLIAAGAQIESGQDLTGEQAGATIDTFKNSSGKTIWQGRALNAQASNGQADSSLAELPGGYTQAFTNTTTADKIRGYTDFPGADIVCSKAGQAVQLALAAASVIAALPTGGASFAAFAFFTAEQSTQLVATTGAVLLLTNILPGLIKDNVAVPDELSGPVGGNLMAYGARAASNSAAIASGGSELAGSVTAAFDKPYDQQDQKEFDSKNLAYKIFNTSDYRSSISKIIDSTSANPEQNLSNFASIFTNFRSVFLGSLSGLLPRAHAADKPYNWGFGRYGIAKDVALDPNYADPYANAEYVTSLLKSDGSYISRIKNCFGDDFNQTDGSIVASSEVNPADSSYLNSNCNDTSDNWKRIQLFINDSREMDELSCYEGIDQDACQNIGVADNGGNSGAVSSGSLPTGSSRDLAQQLTPYIDDGTIRCASARGYNAGCSDITNTAKGISIRGGAGCSVDSLSPALLGMMLELVKNYQHSFTLSALCSDHHYDGMGGHSGGRAADFNTIDGTFMGPYDARWSQAKVQAGESLDRDIASFMPKSTGFGQSQCHSNFSFLDGFNVFQDTCHHQHIQVAQ